MKTVLVLLALGYIAFVQRRHGRRLNNLEEKGQSLMTQYEVLLTKIDQHTTQVAQRMDTLTAKLAAAVTAGTAPDPDVVSRLQAIADHLRVLGTDPADPVPAAPPAASEPVAEPVVEEEPVVPADPSSPPGDPPEIQ